MAFFPESGSSPYIGVRAGRVQLQSLRGYTPDVIYGGSASALQAGISLGVAATVLGIMDIVVEPSYMLREFSSLEWRTISGTSEGGLSSLPRSLNMSGWLVSISLDFSIPRS
jgi:hypothetical protein